MPQLTLPQMLAIAAALAVVFWPQIKEVLARVPAAGVPKPAAGPGRRSPLVVQLLDMQDAVRAINPRAADLLGQAAVLMIGGGPSK